jgi:L,D-peptidoglycan transpeptidase YkuD (ErfK/YbiS/YcfS/YnhG family)
MKFTTKSLNGSNRGQIEICGKWFDCALGKNGTIAALEKREGDGKTPIGDWVIREVYYRADRVFEPNCVFKKTIIQEDFGWCDAIGDINYNKFVKHPYPNSAEKMWREDCLYDICVILGHNDSPIVNNMGSAIFLHCAKPDYSPTEGCVALHIEDLRKLLEDAQINSSIEIIS